MTIQGNDIISLVTGGVLEDFAALPTPGAVTSIETAIRYILSQDSSVAALVFDRIFPNVVPQGEAMPALTFQQISFPRDMTADGPSGLANPRIQVNAHATTYSGAKTLAVAVREALNGYHGTVNGIVIQLISLQDEGDVPVVNAGVDVLTRYGKRLDFEVWFIET
jgi:hypothetical protein